MPKRAIAAALAVTVALAVPSIVWAASQAKSDADDGVTTWEGAQTDIRDLSISQDGATTSVTLGVEPQAFYRSSDYVVVFLDANADGRSEHAIRFDSRELKNGDPTDSLRARVITTPSSRALCQTIVGGIEQHSAELPSVDQQASWTYTFPTSAIGGAATFRWAAYAYTLDLTSGNGRDYMPDGADPAPGRPNGALGSGEDGCDVSGTGDYSDTGESAFNGFVPIDMTGGFSFPDPVVDAGPDGDGGTEDRRWDTQVDTTVSAKMPNVVGLRADIAKNQLLRRYRYVDFNVVEANPARAPKGVGFGDVMTQRPAPGTELDASVDSLPPVTLTVYAGPRPVGRNDCLDRLARQVRGMEMNVAVDALKRAGCRVSYDFRVGAGATATVERVELLARDRVELGVRIPQDRRRHDLFLSVREHPNGLSFKSGDWTLTSHRSQKNFVTVQVVDRAGRFVRNATLRVDTSDVGGVDPFVQATDKQGQRSFAFAAPRAGLVDVVVSVVGANDVAMFGMARLRVVNRSRMKNLATFTTTSGRVLQKVPDGWRPVGTAKKTRPVRGRARTAAAPNFFTSVLGWFRTLVGESPRVSNALAGASTSQAKVRSLSASKRPLFPTMLALGNNPVGMGKSRVVSAGSGNVVSAGGGNVVSAGSGNVISAGGLNLQTVAGSGLVATGGNKLLSDKGAGVVSAGGGNVVSAGGLNLIGGAGGNVISAGGGNVVSAGGLNLIALEGGNVVSAGGLN